LHEMDERSLLEKLLSYPVRVERRNWNERWFFW
jgi:hypothetical protein